MAINVIIEAPNVQQLKNVDDSAIQDQYIMYWDANDSLFKFKELETGGDLQVTYEKSTPAIITTNDDNGPIIFKQGGTGDLFKLLNNDNGNILNIDNVGNLSYHDDAFYIDVVNDRVGIGTANPYASLTIVSQGSSNTRSVVGEHYDNTTAFSQFKFIGSRARGNRGNPSAVLANDSLASFNGRGYKTTGWSDTVGGMYVYANGNWTNSSTPTYITFRGVNAGTTVQEWLRIEPRLTHTFNDANYNTVGSNYSLEFKRQSGIGLRFGTSTVDVNNGVLLMQPAYGTTRSMIQSVDSSGNPTILELNPFGGDIVLGRRDTSFVFGHAIGGANTTGTASFIATRLSIHLRSVLGSELNLYPNVSDGSGSSSHITGHNNTITFRFQYVSVGSNEYTSLTEDDLTSFLAVRKGRSILSSTESTASLILSHGRFAGRQKLAFGYLGAGRFGIQSYQDSPDVVSNINLNPFGGNVGVGLSTAPTATLHVKGNSDSVGNAFRVESLTGNRLIIGNDGKHSLNTTPSTFDLNINAINDGLILQGPNNQLIRFKTNNSSDLDEHNTITAPGLGGNTNMLNIGIGTSKHKFVFLERSAGRGLAMVFNGSQGNFIETNPGIRLATSPAALHIQATHTSSSSASFLDNALEFTISGALGNNSTKTQNAVSINAIINTTIEIFRNYSLFNISRNIQFNLTAGVNQRIVRAIDINHVINQTAGNTQFIAIDYQPTITSITGAHYGILIRPNTLNGFGLGSTLPTANLHVKSASDTTGIIFKVDSNTAERFKIESNGNIFSNGLHMFGTPGDTPQAKVDISASNGYEQFLLRTSYTPSGVGDPNGVTGTIIWDDNYIYVKTNLGWKKATLVNV
jgi:hypothetical protein